MEGYLWGTHGMCGAHGRGGVGHTWVYVGYMEGEVWDTYGICGAHEGEVWGTHGVCGAHGGAHTEQTYGHTWATKGGTRSTRSSTCGAHIWGTHVGHTYGAHAEHFGAHVRHTEVCVQHT